MKLKADFMESLKQIAESKEATRQEARPTDAVRRQSGIVLESAAAIKQRVSDQVEYIDPRQVLPFHSDPEHPPVINENNLELLRPSVKEHGILSPAIVRIDSEQKGYIDTAFSVSHRPGRPLFLSCPLSTL